MLFEVGLQLTDDSSLGQGFQRGRWGKNCMQVRRDLYYLLFNYRAVIVSRQKHDDSNWLNC